MKELSSCSFTLDAEDRLFEAADTLLPEKTDSPTLLNFFRDRMRVIPFGDYLKRYLYLAAGMEGPFHEIPNETYRKILINAFRENVTPASLRGDRVHLSTAAWRWLEYPTAQRDGVLLLGFGLSMTVEDVNLLLTNACHGHVLDPDDPLEGICAHCYARQYSFSRMKLLRSMLAEAPETWESQLKQKSPGAGFRAERMLHDDLSLLRRLSAAEQPTPMVRKTREVFSALYDQVCVQIAKEMNKERAAVTCSDIERHFCPITRLDAHGNMIMTLRRDMRTFLEGKRMSRHRVYMLLNTRLPIRRILPTASFLPIMQKWLRAMTLSRIFQVQSKNSSPKIVQLVLKSDVSICSTGEALWIFFSPFRSLLCWTLLCPTAFAVSTAWCSADAIFPIITSKTC